MTPSGEPQSLIDNTSSCGLSDIRLCVTSCKPADGGRVTRRLRVRCISAVRARSVATVGISRTVRDISSGSPLERRK